VQVEAVLQRALTLAREDVDTDLLQLVLISLGDVAFHIRGDLEKANDYWQEALVLLGKHNTREQRLRVLSNLGMVAGMREEREQAEQYFLEVLSGVKDIQYPELEGMTLLNLGYLYVNMQGKHVKAEDYYKQALEVALHYSFEEKGCLARVVLGELARRRGDVETAEQLLRDAVSVARTLEDPVTLSQTLDGFALIKIEQGKLIEAEQYVQEALALVTNMPYALSAIRGTWGLLLLQQQRLEEAAHQYEIALETLPRGQESMFAEPLYGLARVRFAQGDMSVARQLGEQSLSIMEATHYWRTDEVRQWLKQQITQYAPQASEVTHRPPHQPPPTTQLSPEQRKVVSTTRETSLSEKVTCPSCAQSQGFVKHSHNRSGSQRYQCTACRKVFTPFPRPTGKDEQNKILARQLAAAGMSQRAIGRRLGVHHTTVKAWLMRTITSQ
jgi:transposase-like protein/tetratricopeptide (TPR) repeat protein